MPGRALLSEIEIGQKKTTPGGPRGQPLDHDVQASGRVSAHESTKTCFPPAISRISTDC